MLRAKKKAKCFEVGFEKAKYYNKISKVILKLKSVFPLDIDINILNRSAHLYSIQQSVKKQTFLWKNNPGNKIASPKICVCLSPKKRCQ